MDLSVHHRAGARARHHQRAFAYIAPLLIAVLGACDGAVPTESRSRLVPSRSLTEDTDGPSHEAAEELRALAAAKGIVGLPHPAPVRKELVVLGQALAFDPVLSGNRNISCMTCHLPGFATGDARNLSIGEGGLGLGPDRQLLRALVIPRNAPPLFNLATATTLFWDGRVSVDASGVFHTPANGQLTSAMSSVFEFGATSALGLFPVTSRSEMRGFVRGMQTQGLLNRNELALLADNDFTGIWRALMTRLGTIPEYRRMFEAAYPGTPFSAMTFAHATNAMAGFFVGRLSFNDSPWDRFLAGNDNGLSTEQFRGAKTFVTSRCSGCHGGPAFTDERFRNVALAQFGPGQGNGPSGRDDFGRMNVTGGATEKYQFRTTALRNVELTGPYGHAGQFADLRGFVDHYSESDVKLANYDVNQIDPSLRGTLLPTTADILATRSGALRDLVFTPQEIDDITAYMRALTDEAARHLNIAPSRVPSGLPVAGAASALTTIANR